MNPRHLLALLVYVLLWVATTGYPLDQHRYDKHQNKDKNQPAPTDNRDELWSNDDGRIISVRITSSVAVARGYEHPRRQKYSSSPRQSTERTSRDTSEKSLGTTYAVSASEQHSVTALPPANLSGANIEYIKQLRAKKEGKPSEQLHPFHVALTKSYIMHDDTAAHASNGAVVNEEENGIPRARSIQSSNSLNRLHGVKPKLLNVAKEYRRNTTTTSVRFNIVHDDPNLPKVYSEPAKVYGEQSKVYSEPAKVYSEPAKVYGEPEIFYSEPAKIYGEPSKIYSEPAKVYGEPSKVYSEPAKVYGEPAKYYSEPASLYLQNNVNQQHPWDTTTSSEEVNVAEKSTEPVMVTVENEHQPEKNYEVDEVVSVQTNGRPGGGGGSDTMTSTKTDSSSDQKVGYVEEGEEFKKYRVEERTSDGFIVGEYGVVSNNGSLQGVRYTADGDINRTLIDDALVKFLHLTK